MNKTLKRVITMLLVLAMLFGVCSTTVFAMDSESVGAQIQGGANNGGGTTEIPSDGNDSEDGSVIDSVTTGWCDIEYTADGIVVTLTPDFAAAKLIDAEMLKELAEILVEAVKKVLMEDVMSQLGGGSEKPQTFAMDTSGINVENIWMTALEGYISEKYPVDDPELSEDEKTEQAYLNFLTEVVDKDQAVNDLADYICNLIVDVVSTGIIDKSQLPSADGIESLLITQLNQYIDDFIKSHVDDVINDFIDHIHNSTGEDYDTLTEMDKFVEQYIGEFVETEIERHIRKLHGTLDDENEIDDMVWNAVNGFLTTKVSEVVDEYIAYLIDNSAGFSEDSIHDYIRRYFDTSIKGAVQAYLDGTSTNLNVLEKELFDHIDSYVEQFVKDQVDMYIAVKSGDKLYSELSDEEKLVYDKLDAKVKAYVDGLIADYLKILGGDTTVTLDTRVEEKIEEFITKYFIDNYTTNFATYFANYKAFKTGTAAEKPDMYDFIETFVRDKAISTIATKAIELARNEIANYQEQYDEALALKEEKEAELLEKIQEYTGDDTITVENMIERAEEEFEKIRNEVESKKKELLDKIQEYTGDYTITYENMIERAEEEFEKVRGEITEKELELLAKVQEYTGDYTITVDNMIERVEQEFDKVRVEIETKEQELLDKIKEYTEDDTVTVDNMLEKANEKFDSIRAEIETKKQELLDKIKEYTEDDTVTFENMFEKAEAKFAEIRVQIADAEADIAELEAELADAVANGAPDEVVAELNSEIAKAKADLEAAKSELADAEASIEEFKNTVEEFENTVSEFESKVGEFNDAVNEFNSKVAEFESKIDEFNDVLDEFNSTVAEFESKVKEFEDGLAEFESTAAEFESKLAEYESKLAEFESKSEEFFTEKAKIEGYIDEYNANPNNENGYIYKEALAKYNELTASDWKYIFDTDKENSEFKPNTDGDNAWKAALDGYTVSEDPADYRDEFIGKDAQGNEYVKFDIPVSVFESQLGTPEKRAPYVEEVIAYVVNDPSAKEIIDDYINTLDIPSLVDGELKNLLLPANTNDEEFQKVIKKIILHLDGIKVEIGEDEDGNKIYDSQLNIIIHSLDMSTVLEECLAKLDDSEENNEVAEFIETVHSYFADKNELHSLIVEIVAKLENEPALDGEGNQKFDEDGNPLTRIDELLGIIRDEVIKQAQDHDNDDPNSALNSVIKELLGIDVTIKGVYDRVEFIAKTIAEKYEQTLENLPDGTVTPSIRELLELIKDVKINGESIVGITETGITVNPKAIIKLLADIPTFVELENMTDEEMFLSYDIEIFIEFLNEMFSTDFNITLKLGGGYDEVRKIAAIVNDHFYIVRDGSGKIFVDIKVPDELAKALLKACNSSRVPDVLKDKLFAAISKSPDDGMALINDITLDDLIAILDKVDGKLDFDGLLDKDFVSKFEKLDGLTYDQIKARIKSYEGYYEKAMSILNRAYNYIPDSITNKTLFSFYEGDGMFALDVDGVSVDLYKLSYKALCKVTSAANAEKYANLLASLIDDTSVTLSARATVDFASISKVQYYVGDTVVREGFLPKGADLAFFAGITEYEGNYIVKWLDESGNAITKMPATDTKLTAVLQKIEVDITSNYPVTNGQISTTYGDDAVTLTAALKSAVVSGTTLYYEWYKQDANGVWQKIAEGADKASITLSASPESGSYRVEVTTTLSGYSETSASGAVKVDIAKKTVDLLTELPAADNRWTTVESFEYDAKEHTVTVNGFTVPATVVIDSISDGTKATDAKDYTVTVKFALVDSDNYAFADGIDSFEYLWRITPKEITADILTWIENHPNGEAIYLYGQSHSVDVKFVDASVLGKSYSEIFSIEKIDFEDYTQTNAGTYYANAKITVLDSNFTWNQSYDVTHTWSIAQRPLDLSVYEWNYDAEVGLTYNAKTQYVELDLDTLPDDVKAIVSYLDASGEDATATFKVASAYLDSAKPGYDLVQRNYDIGSSEFKTLEWGIKKKIITAENAEWVVNDVKPEIDPETGKISFTFSPDAKYIFTLAGLPTDLPDKGVIEYKYYYRPASSTVRLAVRANDGWLPWDGINPPSDAGEYKVEIVVHEEHTDNYEIDGTIAATVEYIIKKQVIDLDKNKVELDKYAAEYTGSDITVNTVIPAELQKYIDAGVIVLDDQGSIFTAVKVDDYTVYIKISVAQQHLNNYEVSGEAEYELYWSINKQSVSVDLGGVALDTSALTEYTGNKQSVTVAYADAINKLVSDGIIKISETGELEGVNAGITYTVKVVIELLDKENYEFDSSTLGVIEVTLTWTIEKAKLTVPDLTFGNLEYTYTGAPITFVPTYTPSLDPTKFRLEYPTVTETALGTYPVTVQILLVDDKNYEIESGKQFYTLEFEIVEDKRPLDLGELTWSTEFPSYNGTEQTYAGLVIPDTLLAYVDVKYTGKVSATAAGKYTITLVEITVKAEFAAQFSEVTYTVKDGATSFEWEILPVVLDLGELDWSTAFPTYTGSELTYAGLVIPADKLQYIDVNYTGTRSAVEVGTYTVTLDSIALNAQGTAKYSSVTYTVKGEATSFEWSILEVPPTPGILDLGELTWSTEFPSYNGTEQTYAGLVIPDALLAYVDVKYTGVVSATVAGKHTITLVEITVKTEFAAQYASVTYTVKDGATSFEWEILPVVLDLGELDWSTAFPTYTGSELTYAGLVIPADKLQYIDVNYTGTLSAIEVGAYTVVLDSIALNAQGTAKYSSVIYTVKGEATSFEWSILEAPPVLGTLDLGTLEWSTAFPTYTGSELTYAGLVIPADLLQYLTVEYTGTLTATEVGEYTVTLVKISLNAAGQAMYSAVNYEIKDNATGYEWQIKKATLDIGNVTLDGKTVTANGKPHKLVIGGALPEGITATYTATKDGVAVDYEALTEIGTYLITVTFDGGKNYETKTLTATLVIAEKQQYNSENVTVIAGTRLPDGYEMKENDVTANYTTIDLSSLADAGLIAKLIKAYDVIFYDGNGDISITDGEFTVKMRLPDALKGDGKVIKIVYINANGGIEELEATVEGDYVVFETTHFSVYGIVSVESPDTPPADPGDPGDPGDPEKDLTWLWILLVIIAVLLAVIIILILLKKRKGDEPTEDKQPDAEPEPEPEAEEVKVEETAVEVPVEEEPKVEEPVVEEPVVEEPKVEETKVEDKSVVIPVGISAEDGEGKRLVNGVIVPVRYRTSFMSRLIQAEPAIQDYYTVIKNALLSYKGVKARTSWNFESFNKARIQCAKLNVKGSAFQVYLALDPKEYSESKYHFTDVSDKPKVGDVPMLLKVKSDRALKYALELIDEMMRKLGIEQGEMPNVDYHMPYESTDALADRDLVKVILPAGMVIDENTIIEKVDVGELLKDIKDDEAEAPVVEETVAEEPVVEEPVAEEPVAAPIVVSPVAASTETIEVRYRQSFTSRLIQSDDTLKGFYSEIKNELLSYKGVKARSSWAKETFRKARIPVARMDVKGKMLYLFLALDPKEIEGTKYRFKDVSAKRGGAEYPTLLKIKSARGKNHAIELIRLLMTKLELVRIEREAEDFILPYEETEALVERGLIKVILPKGAVIDENTVTVKISIPDFERNEKTELASQAEAVVAVESMISEAAIEETPVEEAPVVEVPAAVHIVDHHIVAEEIVHVDALKADAIISDEQAKEFIETITHAPGFKPKSSKLYEINLDTICDNYDDGDTVTIESLKSKGLVSKKAERIKILARGTMTKELTIIADKYSIQAVKMIGLAGGLAEKYKD